jgi:hypothetical protein
MDLIAVMAAGLGTYLTIRCGYLLRKEASL